MDQKNNNNLLRLPKAAIKEKPRKRLRVPPNSATREVHTVVSLDRAQKERVKYSDLNEVGCFSPTTSYFLYLQGFLHFVSSLRFLPSATQISW